MKSVDLFVKILFLLRVVNCEHALVTLLVYSSQTNPQWKLNSTQWNSFINLQNKMLALQVKDDTDSNQIMGYQGFIIEWSNRKQIFINQNYLLERFLLETGKSFLSNQLIQHVEIFLGKKSSMNIFSKSFQKTINCNQVPIKGPDTVPIYNPLTDNGGCFLIKQFKNNCYAYATDIVTNTFPQPGRWNGKSPSSITCESIRQASVRDGLVYKGLALNENQPKLGHYLALFLWSNIDYHWVRKDANGYWSHKPGPGRVTNRDNRALLINNPLKSNFTPWTKFCGFYIAQPSKVNIQ